MASKNPSYFQSIPLQQIIEQKELRLHLYIFQQWSKGPRQNQQIMTNLGLPNQCGLSTINDWPIRDGPGHDADIVARGRGLHFGTAIDEADYFHSFVIIFTDERFKGSSLQVLGTSKASSPDGEWAITGGTGEFAFAQGVVAHKMFGRDHASCFRELHIRVLCLAFPKPVLVTKIGPWGGHGGKEFDIPESVPQHLESVTIRSGVLIDSIAFSYVNQAGKKQTLGPWGGDGELSDTITFAPIEIVKEVSGTTGTFGGDTVVTSLTFVTNVRTYGPFGKPSGTAFSVPLTDTSIVGFFVRAGRLVNAIGVYVSPSVQNY
ncbi:hypothetical protein CFC21_043701 [Triticum aestivum]|uniref:Dirigent protein n=2 Tax=Triticum aestivum TaxID=4565 RepID=A0A3B6FW58_WHEAT|nr:jacalin-related lectin 9-like [Triticum aestivum]KAF7032542.1 hypothetical protein CFC21_043701 [Triticum aestivum]